MFKTFSFYLAILGLILMVILAETLSKPEPPLASLLQSPESPYKNTIHASGIIESLDKNINVGPPDDGLVLNVFIHVGEKVKKGTPLFQLDTRALEAKLLVQKANLEVAKADFIKQKEQFDLFKAVDDPKAISKDEFQTADNLTKVMQAKWDVAKAEMQESMQLIDRLTVKAPQDGTILQNELRPGEYITKSNTPIVIGNIDKYQILVSIDEQIASQFRLDSPAVAFPKNDTSFKIPLHFLRIEPFVIPKKSLTGYSEERVDTRVLQVIYTFDPIPNYPLYVGQQMDVFIDKQ